MKWIKILGLILSVICFLLGALQFYRIKKEFQQLDEDQVITDKIAKKWVKRLYWVLTSIILLAILSIVATILPYLK
jgi:ABC-type lipoprotein release transport system permease subunit